ncbi:DUF2798 domain-containing protein [Pragia fontium]|uniref:DUF2798 domain-containing protein n=1 Tax=Pragia fontium TaxID=82985 RepID=A0ABQ5LE27_9GAMM|nr:DUF2798 domain-containing protein [Pragia fontium]GKX61634.1 hypothetical protein SOASR032_02030 [Pragia fontium]SUB82569.1 Protein of uncharacterised function (DUF2798) [Pragia fontium]VEJ55468.1 Protein of uncharacterised function (DUF2798) [Pragia fontium]
MSFQDRNYILGIPKLPARAMIFLVPFFLSFVMSGIVSFISTVKALGLTLMMVSPWISSWGLSWMIAFPTVLFVLPFARKLSLLFVKSA